MLYHIYYVLEVGVSQGRWGGIAGHEVVEDGEGNGAAGLVEEDAGKKEAEGGASERFLDETEMGGGEGREGDARHWGRALGG